MWIAYAVYNTTVFNFKCMQQDLEVNSLKKHWFLRYTDPNFAKNDTDYHFSGLNLKDTQF